ncbi:MAG: cell division protein ZapA [Synergistaceae bacterium]|nr:cell division protein ZapA [Synergistaceae bacterium]
MDEAAGVRKLGDGKYTFIVGRQRYTLTTPLDEERFARVVFDVQAIVDSFPLNLSQEDRLFLALMSLSNQMDEVCCRLEMLTQKTLHTGDID